MNVLRHIIQLTRQITFKKLYLLLLNNQRIFLKPKNPYTFFEAFCIRTPLLPLTTYISLTASENISENKLRKMWESPIIKEAFFLASPELYTEIDKWYDKKDVPDKATLKLLNSFLKYLARISSRCTPFGLFAGCSIGVFDRDTNIKVAPINHHTRQTKFDMNFLVALSQELSKKEAIQKQGHWFANSSLYTMGSQYRFIEYSYNKNNNREHSIEAVDKTSYLEQLLDKATTGTSLQELAAVLISDDITIAEANDFLYELIHNQLLVSELEPAITGDGFLSQIHKIIKKSPDFINISKQLNLLQEHLHLIDKTLGNDILTYQKVIDMVKTVEIPFQKKYLFQTDVYPSLLSNSLQKRWGYKIKRVLSLFSKITASPKNSTIDTFKNAFINRYETREVPLTTVLDTETGIGYQQHQDASDSSPFLDGLSIPLQAPDVHQYTITPQQKILDHKLQKYPANTYSIILTDEDYKDFEERWDDLPDTMSAMTEMVILGTEQKMVILSIGGTSAANLLGRFTTGDPHILEHVKKITNIEQQMYPDQILAEIIHLPQSRTGNVIRRATIREYEIPYLGKSNLPLSHQIFVKDLMVSVQNGYVRLRSKKLNKYIMPRLSNAHNYSTNALPIYQFLCDMQGQKLRTSIGFSWGEILEKKLFLPRVCYQDFILSKARWNIRTEELKIIMQLEDNELMTAFIRWKTHLQLPKFVQLVEGDNTLLLNLENKDCIVMWWETVKNSTQCTIEEFLHSEDCIVKNKENQGFTNQMIISFYNEMKAAASVPHGEN